MTHLVDLLLSGYGENANFAGNDKRIDGHAQRYVNANLDVGGKGQKNLQTTSNWDLEQSKSPFQKAV